MVPSGINKLFVEDTIIVGGLKMVKVVGVESVLYIWSYSSGRDGCIR